MRNFVRFSVASLAGALLACLPVIQLCASENDDETPANTSSKRPVAKSDSASRKNGELEPAEFSLLDAMQKGLIGVKAEGRGDGRITISVTNRTTHRLRVVLPPGIIAQGASGQMGGMGGGMGGMGGGMGGMGGGGMGGGMGGRGGGGMGGGMGGMGRSSGTMPPMMGMMMLSNIIMYFCGDQASWDRRSLMMGMGGGMGGMGGGMGGMGGGMRSVPPSDLAFAELKPKQTRELPTSIVSLSNPDIDAGLILPAKGEKLRILGDIARVNEDPQVQKALKRLSRGLAPASVSQLVMWRLAGRLDWETISQLSQGWSNPYEMVLAKDFVNRLSLIPEGESGRILFEVVGTEAADRSSASVLMEAIRGKTILGLPAVLGIPERPDGPTVACRVRLNGGEAQIQVFSSDGSARTWVPFGKFSLAITKKPGGIEGDRVADAVAEGLISRLVRAQLIKGPRDKGKPTYGIRVENASSLILNGLAVVGPQDKPSEMPKVLWGISVPPRKNMTVAVTEEAVKSLGLKQGIRVMAIDLSGL